MQETWSRLNAALAAYSPKLTARFYPGVDEQTIAQTEQQLGINFPQELRTFFRCQNGSKEPVFDTWTFFSLQEIFDDWLMEYLIVPDADQPEEMTAYLWTEHWLPLMRAPEQMRLYMQVSLHEGEWRKEGWDIQQEQLLPRLQYSILDRQDVLVPLPLENGTLFLAESSQMVHVIATNLHAFLEMLIADLQNQQYFYDAETQRLQAKPDASHQLPVIPAPIRPEPLSDDELFDEVFALRGNRVAYPGLCCISYQRDFAGRHDVLLHRSIAQSWEIIRPALVHLLPEGIERMDLPLSAHDFEQAETHMNVSLPAKVKEWFSLTNELAFYYNVHTAQIVQEEEQGCSGLARQMWNAQVRAFIRYEQAQVTQKTPAEIACELEESQLTSLPELPDFEVLRRVRPFSEYAFDFWMLCSLKDSCVEWEFFQDELLGRSPSKPLPKKYMEHADSRIKPFWWLPQWIPLFMNTDGTFLCIDLDPTAEGQRGQVILLMCQSLYYSSLDIHQVPPVMWVAPNLETFLATLAQDITDGKYTFDTSCRILWSQEGFAYVDGNEEGLCNAIQSERKLLYWYKKMQQFQKKKAKHE